ncbi:MULTISPECIES: DNA primase [unclassified Halomonas]|uniref:DNA primase n=1 Tax=unclassified Halomonas TaxID=2609666 RepID=UPI0004E3B152|nr:MULTISPECIES: DNA primase [unclassified Halomonas]KFC51312.1 DNA primase [Halomonas sp. SUBG004]MCG7576153.1 DNA primase [Halomonas sp. MMH1-48]MCG7603067.1 DNA primase [Halomonas sp. MM17-34]MCG7612317.1 DNA primase [Halomonas sp. MM17-29]MCG7619198.1 DNA primase [Halomonas sp. DSH1-27]
MAGQIPQRFIDDLLGRVDVVEVVGERVQLKKAGRNFSGLCPFHQEKTPSFTVSADKQFYHCFGCGAHGNALRFLMEYDKLPFPEAVEQLAGRLGLDVPREGADDPRAQQREKKRKEGVNLLEVAASFYRERLKMQEGQSAQRYLQGRGLSPEVIDTYGIGYAPGGWEALKQHLSAKGIGEPVQVEYGLLIHREDTGRTYDRFRDRVMFPIRDLRGRTLGFGGRVMGDEQPKYLNSPETPVFHKGRELYGLYEARQASSKLEQLVMVEGYMDVVALAQFGIHNAVATLGTATTEDHLSRLFRLVSRVVFCFDGDRAGRQAASRALETALPQMIDGREARFLFLPEGDDPDSLVRREGSEAFEDRVTCAMPLSEFLFEQAAQGRDLNTVEGRERFASQVLEALNKVPDGMLKSLLLESLAKRSGLAQSQLQALLDKRTASASASPQWEPVDDAALEPVVADEASRPAARRRQGAKLQALSTVARIVQLLLHEPRLVTVLPETLEWLPDNSEEAPLCRDLIALLRAGRYRSPQVVLAHFQGSHEGQVLAELAQRELLIPKSTREAELNGLVEHLLEKQRKRSPQEEYDALLALERSGQRLNKEQRQRLASLMMELVQRSGDRPVKSNT